MKYHLGCGSHYLEGYVNIDYSPAKHNVNHDIKVDLYADILEMIYEPCEEIRSHHFFEHFSYYDTFILLFKWTNALNQNGKLIIDLPNLEELCKAYIIADTKTKFLITRYLYGSHEADWAYHINGWEKDTIEYVLNKLGYSVIDANRYGNFTDSQPNCGITITAILEKKSSPENMKKILSDLLSLYKNGNTEFENSLCDYFVQKFEDGIK